MSTTTNTDGQNTAALTPVSDFVFNFRNDLNVWGRHGNDVLLGFDPAAPTPEAPAPGEATAEDFQWNVLLGDFLDENILGSRRFYARPEETGINGEDRFILGDWRTPYYLDDYTVGAQQAAIIVDFQPELDTIQLHGSREDYILFRFPITFPPAEEGGEPTTFRGKVLVYVGEDPDTGKKDFDLIAFFPNIPPRSTDPSLIGGIPLPEFDLDGDYFIFVGDTPPAGPAEPEILQFGTIGVDISTGVSVDPYGNLYVTGVTTGVVGESNEGSYDFWVAKYNPAGEQEWIQQYGTTHPDIVWDIETFLTPEGEVNFYLTGSTTGVISDALGGDEVNDGYQDIWVARFDSHGNPVLNDEGDPVFVKQNPQEFNRENTIAPLGSEIDNSLQIDVDAHGNLYQSGVTVEQSEAAQEGGLQDFAWVASFDPHGNQRWINDDSLDSPEGFGFDESYGVALASDGTTFAVGFTQLNIGGPDSLIGVYDTWISRFDVNGEQIFIEQFGSDNYDFAWGVDTDSEDNAYVVGATAGDFLGPDGNPVAENAGFYDIFLAKFSKEGVYEWAIQFGTAGDDAQYLGDIVVDAFDNIYITGFTNSDLGGPNQGGYDTWVASYDVHGNRNWITQFGSSEQDNPTSIDVDNNGSIYVTGLTEGSLGAINEGSTDIWVAKLDAATGALQNFGSPKPANFIVGTQEDDTLIGTEDDDTIKALGGDDFILGEGGNDFIEAGSGNNIIGIGEGNATVFAGSGDDFVYTTAHTSGTNKVDLGDGNNTVYLENGNNLIKTGDGEDLIGVAFGHNTVYAGGGDDFVYSIGDASGSSQTIYLGEGDNTAWFESGDYTITAGSGNDEIGLGDGSDTVKAGNGNNVVYMVNPSGTHDGPKDVLTGSGNDWVQTGSGDDRLDLGTNSGDSSGFDIAFGQGGQDAFVLNVGGGYLTIGDFVQGEDVLEISGIAFNDIGSSVDTSRNSTWVWDNISSDVLAELQGFTGTLTANDFAVV